MEIPIDPHVELFKWGPAPLRYFYQSDFNQMMGGGAFAQKYPKYLWPPSLAFYIDHTILWVNEFDALRERGQAAFIDVFLNGREQSIRRDYQQMSDELARLERRIDDVAVVKIDDADLMKLWRELHRAIIGFITPGLIPELCNYGADRLLEDKLKGYLGASVDSIPTLMEVLTAPEEISFYQEEEMRLAETDDIAEHQRQYYWIGNSYSQVEALPQSFFIERKKNLLPGLREKSRLRIVEVQRNKDDVRGKYFLPEEIMSIGKAIESSVLWQDNRKENILRYLHYKNMLLDEVICRKGWRKDDLLNFSFEEIAEMFTGIDYTEQIEERKKGFAEYITNTRTLLNADESRKYFELYSNKEASGDEREISGIVASKGFATGRVRILLDPHQSDRLLPGEVLVAPMTSPEYIFAMRRAVAIVTDSGGLTSHAAIVSRELEVPCIVGTGVATQVLHDGDLVEVDADRGVVRVIQRASL